MFKETIIRWNLILWLILLVFLSGCSDLVPSSDKTPLEQAAETTSEPAASTPRKASLPASTAEELPCLIHCNPPYEAQPTAGQSMPSQADVGPVIYDGLPCLTYCNPPYHTQ